MPSLSELIAAADPADVGVFTAFALLPHTVALSGLSVFGYLGGGPFPGWDAGQMRELAWGRDAPAGRRAVCRIQFRDAHGGGGSRPEMVDRRVPGQGGPGPVKSDRRPRGGTTPPAGPRRRR